jgi:hypothetical protein
MITNLLQLLSRKCWVDRMDYPDKDNIFYLYQLATLTDPDDNGAQWRQVSAESYGTIFGAIIAFLNDKVEFMEA